MQKKIIALAIAAAASTAAFAQTNVTVYGVVDLGQAWVKSSNGLEGVAVATPASTTNTRVTSNQGVVGRLDSNSSYIGFKGVEDLGNGLKAVFQYETGFTADNAGALSGGRDTYVGVAGAFGTAVAGTLTHPLRAFGVKAELAPGAAGFGTMASVTGTLNLGGVTVKTGADDRATNALAYISPSFGGFSGAVAYVNGENKTAGYEVARTGYYDTINGGNSRQWQVAGQYDNGPLFVGAGYHKAKAYNVAFTDPTVNQPQSMTFDGLEARVIRLVAAYTLPTNTKLTALYDNTKVDADGSIKRTAWSLGAAQSFGKNTVGLEYGRAGKTKVDGEAVDGTSSHIVTALYTYELSKRTLVQARYSKLTNGDAGNSNFYNNPVANGAVTYVGSDYTGYMVGLRHSF